VSVPRAEGEGIARIVGVRDDIVRIEALARDSGGFHPLTKNEVVLVRLTERDGSERRLKAEVLRVHGRSADAQVYEDTAGVAIGDLVEGTGALLSVDLGPGLLGQVYDGLQAPLEDLAALHGYFLPRGVAVNALDTTKTWAFVPHRRAGDAVGAGDVLGHVMEGRFTHKIMAPFDLAGRWTVEWIEPANATVAEPIARLADAGGHARLVPLAQRWPVRRALPAAMLAERRVERLYPDEPLITRMRLIDSFFPVARGGTACIPGPFGAGKTVLQNLISRHAAVDVVVIVACGERAGEVVETITEFPKTPDPQGEGVLMDRTVIVCNTSAMPVAAREASIYTGLTVGEYYRQMGLNVLLIADSTSRWAQAMRETSGRLEEIPGEEAFPAYLDSAIKGIYERAGVLRTADGSVGSLTMIGTVSPAGGNFEEPVTQSTLATVKAFLGLSAERAYKRYYPAVDPLLSWSRYLQQLRPWYERELEPGWVERIRELTTLMEDGDAVEQMMQVTGEEGVTLEDFTVHQKARFLDMVYLQQDAFDPVDAAVPLARQTAMLRLVHRIVGHDFAFADKEAARSRFTRLTALFRDLNYSPTGSPDYERLLREIRETAEIAAEPGAEAPA
jgi:V/A-type H+-transporting ATPase subunit A